MALAASNKVLINVNFIFILFVGIRGVNEKIMLSGEGNLALVFICKNIKYISG
jgi:hypothetical protein